jgi:hypothetical protein
MKNAMYECKEKGNSDRAAQPAGNPHATQKAEDRVSRLKSVENTTGSVYSVWDFQQEEDHPWDS